MKGTSVGISAMVAEAAARVALEATIQRQMLVKARDKAHHEYILAVRNKQDPMNAYTAVNRAMQELLAFDARNNS